MTHSARRNSLASRDGASSWMLVGAALTAVIGAELGREWVLSPILILPGVAIWLALLVAAFYRRLRTGLLLLLTLPAGILFALGAHLLYRVYLGLPVYG